MDFLFKSAKIVDTTSEFHNLVVDVLVKGGEISEISPSIEPNNAYTVIDASGLCLSQGWVDVGTHYKDPGYEWLDDLHSLSKAAAAGGFTHLLGFPNTSPVVQNKEALGYFRNFSNTSAVKLSNLAAVTRDCGGAEFTDMIDLKTGGAIGFSDGKAVIHNSDIFLKALLYLSVLDTVLVVKSEDKYLSMYGQMHEGYTSTLLGMKGLPAAAEELMIIRNLKLLEYSGVKSDLPVLHFSTISTEGSVQLIREAKSKGLPVSCDVAAHHLVFEDNALLGFNTNFKVYPPFRETNDINALKAGLIDGTIDFVVSDHNPWDEEHKTLEFDAAEFGAVGLQTVFPVLNGILGTESAVAKLDLRAKEVFRIKRQAISVGVKADFTLFSDSSAYTFGVEKIVSKAKNSPFIGKELKGEVKAIFSNGILKKVNE